MFPISVQSMTSSINDPHSEADLSREGISGVGDYSSGARAGYNSAAEVLDAVNRGALDPYTAQYYLTTGARGYMAMTEEQEKYFNNLLARYQSKNGLIWQAEQLQALGLSNAGVLQTGAAHSAQDWSNVASRKADRAHKTALSMIDMAGRMGSAGIHGAALSAVKSAAGKAATLTAHSAQRTIDNYDRSGRRVGYTKVSNWDNYHYE